MESFFIKQKPKVIPVFDVRKTVIYALNVNFWSKLSENFNLKE